MIYGDEILTFAPNARSGTTIILTDDHRGLAYVWESDHTSQAMAGVAAAHLLVHMIYGRQPGMEKDHEAL